VVIRDIVVKHGTGSYDISTAGTPVPVGRKIESDPRFAPLDRRLNAVYSTLRTKLSPAKREQLKQFERDFISRRDRLRNNPDGYFALTEQQIATLQQMLDARK
jgi:hypothetical protein